MAFHGPDTVRQRVSQIFRYLENLNQLRNPAISHIEEQPWHLWVRELPVHESVILGTSPKRSEAEDAMPLNATDELLLRVARPKLTSAPQPPDAVATWLNAGWDRVEADVSVQSSKNREDSRGQTFIENFDDDPARIAALQQWKLIREKWLANERPARAAMKLFERLYELHGRLEREGERYEVVLGDGILNWRRPDGGISHPILLQRAQLLFDPEVPEFTIKEADHGPELYTAVFRTMEDVDGRRLSTYRERVERELFHPLGEGDTDGFLKSFLQQLAPRAEFLAKPVSGMQDDPRMWRDPVFFLRARSLGFANAIEAILEAVTKGAEIPRSLVNISGTSIVRTGEGTFKDDGATQLREIPEDDILFSKASNKEQFQIAARLAVTGNVLVQGPPGTGKTHTIANLIGDLLAQGKKVLVTSQTTKALRVLRDQVVAPLQPLCVSVLESDTESRRQLEASVSGIVHRLAHDDATTLDEQAKALAARRKLLCEKRTELTQALLMARGNEYRDIIVGGQGFSPSEAARWVASNERECSWIPSPVEYGAPLPLSESEFARLYSTNRVITQADEAELDQSLPAVERIPTPAEFELLVARFAELRASDCEFKANLWAPNATDRALVSSLLNKLMDGGKALGKSDPDSAWKITVIDAARRGEAASKTWESLVEQIETVQREADAFQEDSYRFGPNLSAEYLNEDGTALIDEVLSYLQGNGTLGSLAQIMHPAWKKLMNAATVNGRSPRTLEEFRVLRAHVRLHTARTELRARWKRQMEPLGAIASTKLTEMPERICMQYVAAIRDCLVWWNMVWLPLEKEVVSLLDWPGLLAEIPPVPAQTGDLVRLRSALGIMPKIFSARIVFLERQEICNRLAKLVTDIEKHITPTSISVSDLREAIIQLNTHSYSDGFRRIVELHQLREQLTVRRGLLNRLEQSAQGWAAAISRRNPPHDKGLPPGEVQSAWRWRQLHDELERRTRSSIHELQKAIEDVASQIADTTSELIDRRAWHKQLARTNTPQRQALIGWLDTIRRIGRGTGRRVPRLLEEAKRLMNEAREAVPIWIMPLARVVDNFDPRSARFDVLIIDEASQCDVMGLISMFMANEVVVVGDHEQVSPEAIGQKTDQVQHLIDIYLANIPNAHLYDGKMSIYDLARQSFGGLICLQEHYRCVPDIIQFSNMLSYQWQIKPLRDPASTLLGPHVAAHRVEGIRNEKSKSNQIEAEHICALICACVEQPEYAGKTFGVISLLGEEQSELIESRLRSIVPPSELSRRRLLCGNAAHFQGDERDVMFLSVVDSPIGGPHAMRDTDLFRKRYNVAASRAKDQMWVVHSLNPENDLQPGDLRRRLIEYAMNPAGFTNATAQQERRTQSEFERLVLRRLAAAGYKAISQRKVGYYSIDLVVEGAGKRLAIECDGDRYHPIEQLAADMHRQAVLERLGWRFVRIRGSEFFRNPDAAMNPVFARLQALEIPPEGDSGTNGIGAPQNGDELRARVLRRAEAFRIEWRQRDKSEDVSRLAMSVGGPN